VKTPINLSSTPTRSHHNAFSLIELLVVISIIMTTAALLLPAAMKTRDAAMNAWCKSNLKSIAIGDRLYRDSNNQWIVTMGSHFAPSPSFGGVNVIRPDEPDIYKDLWPESITWCPSLKHGQGYVVSKSTSVLTWPEGVDINMNTTTPNPSSTVPTTPSTSTAAPAGKYDWVPMNFVNYTTFGYARPAIDEYGGPHYPSNRRYRDVSFPNPRNWPTYVKMDYTGPASSTHLDASFQPEGTRPLASDLIASITPNAHVTPHNGLIGKANGQWPGDPKGANAVWVDGSVTWLTFPGKLFCYTNYKDVATGLSSSPVPGPVPDEAFAQETIARNYWFPVRRGH
jgi:prepilin-type processing-associated H-X9-DG protein